MFKLFNCSFKSAISAPLCLRLALKIASAFAPVLAVLAHRQMHLLLVLGGLLLLSGLVATHSRLVPVLSAVSTCSSEAAILTLVVATALAAFLWRCLWDRTLLHVLERALLAALFCFALFAFPEVPARVSRAVAPRFVALLLRIRGRLALRARLRERPRGCSPLSTSPLRSLPPLLPWLCTRLPLEVCMTTAPVSPASAFCSVLSRTCFICVITSRAERDDHALVSNIANWSS